MAKRPPIKTVRINEAVGRIADVLTTEFDDLSSAEHLMILHFSIYALIEGVSEGMEDEYQEAQSDDRSEVDRRR